MGSTLMKYTVEVTSKARKSLTKIDPVFAKKIRDRLRFLEENPRPHDCLKLEGSENAYRTRVGRYRIIYEIFDSKIYIVVVNIDHRKDVYR
jgi:mRNA interferase RelE/StbE